MVLDTKIKEEIDNLAPSELIQEMMSHSGSRFVGEAHDYLTARYVLVEKEEETKHKQQQLMLAREANDISKSASKTANRAYYVSVASILVEIIPLASTIIKS